MIKLSFDIEKTKRGDPFFQDHPTLLAIDAVYLKFSGRGRSLHTIQNSAILQKSWISAHATILTGGNLLPGDIKDSCTNYF